MAEAESLPPPPPGASRGYRVELEVFTGPMDLLLYLIKKEEIDIYDIPIARILDQYLAYLARLEHLELDEVGDFLVMAAQLMLIKARTLAPEPVELGDDEEGPADPRAELVARLLEYQRIKAAAQHLAERWEDRRRRFGPGRAEIPGGAVPRRELKVELWDVAEAYARLVREVGSKQILVAVGEEDRPVRHYMEEIRGRLLRQPRFSLIQLLKENARTRLEAVSYFMALLELIRLGEVEVEQREPFGPIWIEPRRPAPAFEEGSGREGKP